MSQRTPLLFALGLLVPALAAARRNSPAAGQAQKQALNPPRRNG
jgi:hypothetical protein